ncbi:hypothetical protein L901_17600 [Agrobacterium sp. D14]|uniref:SDR family NAD(P)-dependent oxidoreductase n=1 Tax=Agrobacterium TaxID=357 RepID=UPI0007459DBB|nr:MULTISPECIES: SDR family NAD(P)-dependent oxidoreductase [Agrobacterium]KVK54183.1 hypothetical protein L901_17600 [Agrobacterium sp. D14]
MLERTLFNLDCRHALVTGSSQGAGLAIAEGLASYGASVTLNGRDPAKLEAARRGLEPAGAKVKAAAFDVTDAKAAEDGVRLIEERFGPIDILINNAGMQFRSPLDKFPLEKWNELLRTNISSVFYVSQRGHPSESNGQS